MEARATLLPGDGGEKLTLKKQLNYYIARVLFWYR